MSLPIAMRVCGATPRRGCSPPKNLGALRRLGRAPARLLPDRSILKASFKCARGEQPMLLSAGIGTYKNFRFLRAPLPIAPRPEVERLASVEAYLAAVGATVRLGGDRAFYSPATDSITLPRPEQFESVSAFYATSCHEHAHYADRRVMPRRRSSHRASLVRQAL